MKLKLHSFDLRLRHVFTISRESVDVQPTLIVELEQDGVSGYGEATANSYYGATIENMANALWELEPLLAQWDFEEPTGLWEACRQPLAEHSFALCALDQAAHDLWGKLQGQAVWQLWGLSIEHVPLTNYTIGIDAIDKMVAKMQEFPNWPVYKIKLGTDHDVEIVRELRRHTDAVFRVDANCAWSADEAIENSEPLKELGVEFIEQPLPRDAWDEMERVFAGSALPLMADESCIVPEDVARCQGRFHGVNIKLVKCGGLTPARRMIADARSREMKVMVGCMTESSVGISAIAQLLPELDFVDMDGAILLAEDIARGVSLDNGRCIYPVIPGNGVTLLGEHLLTPR